MTGPLMPIISRDVRRSYRSGSVWLPIIFYLSAATLFPFAVGPDPALLLKTGGGILWISALLATLLPLDQLIQPDIDDGTLDQLLLRGWSDEWIALSKIISHAASFGPPLVIAAFFASLIMGLNGPALITLLLGLAIAVPALAALSVTMACLTAGLRGAGALSGLLLLPLAIPMLIFGAGALSNAGANAGANMESGTGNNGLLLLAACALFTLAIAPFAAGAALRAGRE